MSQIAKKSPLVECVPNFSEGRDSAKIKQIVAAIESVSGTEVLGVEPGADTNRTVVTFVGGPAVVAEAAFRAIDKAAQLIDMSVHQGAHPRMGATDVCPFVPVKDITLEECAAISREVGARVGSELGIPVYLYEAAAREPHRKNLADIRKGEYEGLARKMSDPKWKPDFGPAAFNARAGATVMGAREFLIAYNINLNSADKNHASEIAYELRERGRVARTGNTKPFYFRGTQLTYAPGKFPCGNCAFNGKTIDETAEHCGSVHGYDLLALLKQNDLEPAPATLEGQKVYRPGKFKECKAIGWYVSDYQRAQISINLTNFKTTPPHAAMDEARRLAFEKGLVVTGSEIVGVVPYEALLESGRHYLRQQGKSIGVPTDDILKTAVNSLGLNDVAPFDVAKKVLGLPKKNPSDLIQKTVVDFTDEVSRETPAPGGGSIAALAGALGAALASMVANLTQGKEGSESRDDALCRIAERSQELKGKLLAAVDADTQAFNAFMEARKFPQATPEEKAHRAAKMQEGLKIAIEVPWATAESSFAAMELAREAVEIGNPNSVTDAAVGAQIAYAGVRGGIWNVEINLKGLKQDPAYVERMKAGCGGLLAKADRLLAETVKRVSEKM